MYVVWRRGPDNYVGVTTYTPRAYTANGKNWTYATLHKSDDWPDANHALLDARGVEGADAHRDRNCVRCWRDSVPPQGGDPAPNPHVTNL